MDLSKKRKKYIFVAVMITMIGMALFVLKKSIAAWKVAPFPLVVSSTPLSHATSKLLNFEEKRASWKSEKQPDGQPPLFELFNPPNIYRSGNQIVMEPCTNWQFDFVFPLQLKHIAKKKYRLQLEGYVQADEQSNLTILIRDLENNQTLHCCVGQVLKSLDFEILSFQLRTTEKNDMAINIPVVKIRDTRDKIEVELTGDTKYYDNKYVAIVEDLDGKTYNLSNIGQEVKIGESSCVLESIDAENNIVSVLLVDANREEFHKKLRILK